MKNQSLPGQKHQPQTQLALQNDLEVFSISFFDGKISKSAQLEPYRFFKNVQLIEYGGRQMAKREKHDLLIDFTLSKQDFQKFFE